MHDELSRTGRQRQLFVLVPYIPAAPVRISLALGAKPNVTHGASLHRLAAKAMRLGMRAAGCAVRAAKHASAEFLETHSGVRVWGY